jgi:ankyrin repeat protein
MVLLFGTFRIKNALEKKVEKGANVNLINKDGETPLELTTSLEIVKILVENGATEIGQSLHFAAQIAKLDILEYLLEKGAEINTKNREDGKTALHIACLCGNLDVVTYLTEKGADLVGISYTLF